MSIHFNLARFAGLDRGLRQRSKPRQFKACPPASHDIVASPRTEISAQNVLAAQLALHNQFEAKTPFAPIEPIPASVYLARSGYGELRRIAAFLISDDAVVENKALLSAPTNGERSLTFVLSRRPALVETYQVRLVEIARSNAKPVLLARLFLTVE